MEQLECPSPEQWSERQQWFEVLFDIEKRPGHSYLVGEHSTGLLVELQSVYCAGAFVAALILSCTIIDAHLREVELGGDFGGGIKAAFDTSDYSDELNWLRLRRNRLVHFDDRHDLALTIDDHFSSRDLHVADARRAITLVGNMLFENPGT